MTTHTDLITACQAIGTIAQASSWYTQRLADRVAEHGGLGCLSVTDLIEIDRELSDEVARAYAEALV